MAGRLRKLAMLISGFIAVVFIVCGPAQALLQKSILKAAKGTKTTTGTLQHDLSVYRAKDNNDNDKASASLYKEGEVLVRYRKGIAVSQAKRSASLRSYVLAREFRVLSGHTGKTCVMLKSGSKTTPQMIADLRQDPTVEAVSPNYIRRIFATSNDSGMGELWGMQNTGQIIQGIKGIAGADIRASEAWNTCTGSSNVVIADIDTGVDYTHLDLAANMWRNPGENPGDGNDNDGNGYVDDVYGIDACNNDSDPMDDNGHGTHTSGTIAAVGNNGVGVAGVCWSARIMALKFLDASGGGSDADAIQCIEYVVDMKKNHGINVVAINASWGGGGQGEGDLLEEAITAAGEAGIVFCAAAGNEDNDNDGYRSYPASYNLTNIVSVAATDNSDILAYFSNYGMTTVDLAAPGVDILSTLPSFGGGYEPGSGSDVFFDNVEDGSNGWMSEGTNNLWAPSRVSYHSALYAWSDSPGGNYGNYADARLISPIVNLSSIHSNLVIGFWAAFDLESNKDYLHLEVCDDGGRSGVWNRLQSFTGSSPWQRICVALPSSYNDKAKFRFRFRLITDGINTADGVYIDDIGLGIGTVSESNRYDYYSGTSMATPHVAGAAALLAAAYPDDSMKQRISRLLSGVDKLSSLSGKVTTSGRLNVVNSIDPALTLHPFTESISPVTGLISGAAFTVNGTNLGDTPGQIVFCKQRSYIPGQGADIFFDNLESGNINWSSGGTSNSWAVSTEASHSPTHAWSDSPGSVYYGSTNSYIVSRNIDLSGVTGNVALGFWATMDVEPGYDGLLIEISKDGGVNWSNPLTAKSAVVPAWTLYNYAIPDSYRTSQFRVRFRLVTDDSYSYDGVHIDDIGLGEYDASIESDESVAGITAWSDTSVTAVVQGGLQGKYMFVRKADGSRSGMTRIYAWAQQGTLLNGRDNHGAASVADKIYVFGGYMQGGSLTTAAAEVYNPATDSWSSIASMPTARADLAAAELDGKIYCVGGYNDATDTDLSDVTAYDPATNKYTAKRSLSQPTVWPCLSSLDGKLYLTGGISGDNVLSTLLSYDPATNLWSALTPMRRSRVRHSMVTLNGKIYVFGGYDGSTCLASGEVYDPVAGSWSDIADMPLPLL
ncbi:MAG: S8 family serine peptidase, partial [bacterium]|nr:S8 family serine peptidase [bacterium]